MRHGSPERITASRWLWSNVPPPWRPPIRKRPGRARPSAAARRAVRDDGAPPIALAALAALLLFAAVAGALAWRQYHDAQQTALNNARARAVLARPIFDIYFGGQIGTLTSIAQAPVVQAADEAGMLAYFKRVQPPKGKLFPGGLVVGRSRRHRRASPRTGSSPARIADVSDRSYFRAARSRPASRS